MVCGVKDIPIVLEGFCRGGPLDGKVLRHPINFYPMGTHQGLFCGQYVYAITRDWIWMEVDRSKVEGGLLE